MERPTVIRGRLARAARAGAPPETIESCAASTTRPAPATISATGSRATRPRRLPSAASWPLSWWAVALMPPTNVEGRPPVKPGSGPKHSATAKQARKPAMPTTLYGAAPGAVLSRPTRACTSRFPGAAGTG